MIIEIKTDNVLANLADALGNHPGLDRALRQGLQDGGNKALTQVRRALHKQTSVKAYRSITGRTSGRAGGGDGDLSYVIRGTGTGMPISEFPTRYSPSKRTKVRWDKREHWRLQQRDGSGRFGPLTDTPESAVSAMVWGSLHRFQRSFAHPDKGLVMQREAGKPALRKLYGPSVSKELTKGESLATFGRVSRDIVLDAVTKRVLRLFPK